jgi:undecaprenyl-diphosphatase
VEEVADSNAIIADSGFLIRYSAGVIVFMGVLAYFAWQHWQSTRSRALIGVSLSVVVGVVGFDRVYLGVHWLSDVFGGWFFGAFWLTFVVLVFQQLQGEEKFESKRLSLVAKLLYVVAVVVSVFVILFSMFGNFANF